MMRLLPSYFLFLLLLATTVPQHSFSQALIGDSLSHKMPFKIKRIAKQSIRYNDSYSAIELYEIYCRKRPKRLDARMELGSLYQQTRNYAKALNCFNSVVRVSPDAHPKAWFYKAQSHKNLEQFDSARFAFEAFQDRYKGLADRSTYRKLLKSEMEGLELADSLFKNKLPVIVTNPSSLNHRHSEAGIMFLSDSLMYYTTMDRDELPVVGLEDSLENVPRMKILTASLRNGKWQPTGELSDEINATLKHTGNPVIDPDGKHLYFTYCSENWQGKNVCNIYVARKVNGKWKDPQSLGNDINMSGYTSTQPAIAIEPKRNRPVLYFVSDRPGGRGGLDIYWTRYNKRDEEWSKPRNAGGKINSAGNEETPWYDQQKGTLYFSSDGHPGIGGMDIFSSIGDGSSWSEPEILGVPINSTADDVYYRKQPRDRYHILTSNRPGSLELWNSTCCDDIFEIFFPTSTEMMLRITAFELPKDSSRISGIPPKLQSSVVNVYLYDPTTGEKFLMRRDSMPTGDVSLNLDPGKIYFVEVEHPGYFTDNKIIDLRKNNINDTVDAQIGLRKWDEQPIVIPNIYFEFGSARLTQESMARIDTTMLKLMNDNPTIVVEIGAHTDSKGSDELNMKLSDQRAKSIEKYMISKGVDKDRISGKGYGETRPVAPNENPDGTDNPEGRAKNRRVDFKVIGTKLDIRHSD
ncbi:MAG: OmpA family protein [Flavobacteriales bacterium]